MTTALSLHKHADAPTARHPRPRGLDRAVIVLSVAALRWARRRSDRRADRSDMTRDEHARAIAALYDAELRDQHSRTMALRVF